MFTSSTDLWRLPTPTRTLVEAELDKEETVTWVGTPIAWRFGLRSLPIVLFAIPWTAFALFWIAGASGFKMPNFQQGFDFFPLFGIPFVLFGLGMLSSPFWVIRKARRTVYVLTTKRAIVFEGGFTTTIQSFTPDRLKHLRRTQRADGSGDIIFEHTLSLDHDRGQHLGERGFFAIPDVKSVETLIRQLVDSDREKAD